MELTFSLPHSYTDIQSIKIDKVATLIGENGCGKSSILQSVFEQRLNGKDHNNLRIICFSSGQNESYSKPFSAYLKKERKVGSGLKLDCFYFNKSWSKLLIFLATATKRNGKVRDFLVDHGYVTESDHDKDDLSTQFECGFRIHRNYIARVQDALKRQERGETDTLRETPYFRSLESFITNLVSREYEFEQPLRKRTINLTANGLIKVSFDYPRQVEFGDDEAEFGDPNAQFMSNSWEPEVAFFTQAADNNYFIDKPSCRLIFNDINNNTIELDQLSDGEYQLLFLYALIDLFDSENTLFLFDEADSHLHYKNIEKLWTLLHSIKGHAITTTHLLDSISAKENRIEHLKVVEKGRISDDNKIKQLINRLSVLSRAKSVEFEVCGKLPNIALLDDYNDWIIFLTLAVRRGLDTSRLTQVHAIKKTSSCTSDAERLGQAKVDWVKGLGASESQLNTTRIFLICDRDEANPNWQQNGVELAGKPYKDLLKTIRWPNGLNTKTYLLAWKRREIKNYLLSYTALEHFGVLEQINGANIAAVDHLKAGDSGDNDSIRRVNVKATIDPLINADGEGLNPVKLQAYIDLIPPEEISEDITNMYNFIIGKL